MINYIWENIFKKAEEKRSLTRVLGDNLLFSTLLPNELKFVEKIVHERDYRAGEHIFRQGEVGVGMYIIVKGSIDITILEKTSDSDSVTKEVFVTRLEDGDFFGELSLVEENGRRTATATAMEDTHLIGFFKPDLIELLERNPSTGVKVVFRLAQVLGQRLKDTTDRVSHLKSEIRMLSSLAENPTNNGH